MQSIGRINLKYIILMKGIINYMLIIDRIEEGWAIIEYERITFNIPLSLLPQDAKEGDVINMLVTVNESTTKSRSENIKALAKDLFVD
jgi:hypothetical protein